MTTSHFLSIMVDPETAHTPALLDMAVRKKLPKGCGKWRLSKKSIDARGRKPMYQLQIEFLIGDGEFDIPLPPLPLSPLPSNASVVHIAGMGPAGMFAALELIKSGIKPVIIERGKAVKDRRRDLAAMTKEGVVHPDSNYCFGEGGAGTYSDGKLYTRSGKRGSVTDVLRTFVAHGASEDILVNARPHIGTNKLPGIVENIRHTILRLGGEILFETKLTNIVVEQGKLRGIEVNHGPVWPSQQLILATGHSARDIFELLNRHHIPLLAKPFALGVRIEHPQSLIDRMQYRCEVPDPFLPPAYYQLVTQVRGRGVFSFCMCPGGIIAPASTQEGELVVNGWSPSRRNGPYANSGMVVSVNEKDWQGFTSHGALAAMAFQQSVEQKAWQAGGGKLKAPAQRLPDFLNGKSSSDLPSCSYLPGVVPADIMEILPTPIAQTLRDGLQYFAKNRKEVGSKDAIVVATESRTSSPVTIPRDPVSLEHPDIKGLFPCGEGGGYAGGIVSAAIDGINCAKACKKTFTYDS